MKSNIKDWFDNDVLICQQYENSNHQDLKILKSLKPNKTILSLGCAGGREVKELVKNKNKVVGVDFSEEMIKSSKQIEPNAEYYCGDVLDFFKKDKRKFDYILGLTSFINYLDSQEKRDVFFNEIKKRIKEDGEIILIAHFCFREWKSPIQILIAPLIALVLGDRKYKFRDVYSNKLGYLIRYHIFSKREINNYFWGFEIKYDRLGWDFIKITIKN